MQPTLLAVLKALLRVAVPLAAFATGLRAATCDPVWLLRRPGLLARSLLVVLVVVPASVVLFLRAAAVPPVIAAGLTIAVVAIGIGPPAALHRLKTSEDTIAYELDLNVLLLALAIAYIPAVVALHGALFGTALRLGPAAVARVVLGRALVPLLVGVLLGRLLPRVVAPLARYAGLFVQAVLLSVVVVALLATWHGLLGLGARAWLVCVAIVLGEIAIGQLAGGPDPGTRRVLASFSAVRFPALALLLASLSPRGRAFIPIILAYILTSVVLVAIHDLVTTRMSRQLMPKEPSANTEGALS
jgi:bile acid:Na+ symporter, BASS family